MLAGFGERRVSDAFDEPPIIFRKLLRIRRILDMNNVLGPDTDLLVECDG